MKKAQSAACGPPVTADRGAVALGDEECAVGRDRGGEADDRRTFLVPLPHACGGVRRRHQSVHLRAHDRRDHLEGGGVAYAADEEQEQEHGEEAGPAADTQEVEDAHDADSHADEYPEGDAAAAVLVRHPSRERARQRADQRAEECVGECVHLGELRLGEQREARRIADERAEGAGVEPAHDPVVLPLEDHRLLGERGLGRCDVVHAEPGGEGAGDDERHPDVAGVLQPHRHASAGLLDHDRLAAEPAEYAGRDDERHHELHDADAEIAESGIERERVALLRLGKEERDVGHRGGEVAATEAAQQCERQEQPIGRRRILHGHADADAPG